MNVTRTLLMGAAGAGVVLLTACGSSTTASPPVSVDSPSGTTSATSGSTSTAHGPSSPSVPNPAATESNPPGDIPDNQAYVAFSPSGAAVSLKVPEGWARATTSVSTVFTDKLNRIEIQTSKVATAPTTASVMSIDVPRLRGSVPKLAAPRAVAVSRTAGPAVLLTYQRDSAVDPVTGKVVRDAVERYSFFRAGTRVDLTLAGPTNADNVDPWRIVSDSVRWTS
ncbi:MAG: hypothetical protein M3Y71_18610 [Actinomycetota bacterium]|nr:hypothetical protein [Actinomycetota bacterium]